jgi:hypothetical protein
LRLRDRGNWYTFKHSSQSTVHDSLKPSGRFARPNTAELHAPTIHLQVARDWNPFRDHCNGPVAGASRSELDRELVDYLSPDIRKPASRKDWRLQWSDRQDSKRPSIGQVSRTKSILQHSVHARVHPLAIHRPSSATQEHSDVQRLNRRSRMNKIANA